MNQQPDPCRCPTYDPSCKRNGYGMCLREWEVCSQKCPSSRPCSAAMSDSYRRGWDGLPPADPVKVFPVTLTASGKRKGPGTELKSLLQELGISYSSGCACNDHAARMDAWGIHGCKENSRTIIGWLRDGAESRTWLEKIRAGAAAVLKGVVLNPFDPYGSLVTEAILRAERKEG